MKPTSTALAVAIERKVDIAKYEIPVLIYSDPTADLPDI